MKIDSFISQIDHIDGKVDQYRSLEARSVARHGWLNANMSRHNSQNTVGALPEPTMESSHTATGLTWLVWLLFGISIVLLGVRAQEGLAWELPGVITVDGLTILMWLVITFLSGIVHSYSRRYMAGSHHETRFFMAAFGFTIVVMGFVAADHFAIFGALWLAMGLVMAELIGLNRGWPQAQSAKRLARKYFIASTAFLGIGVGVIWRVTGATAVSTLPAGTEMLGGPVLSVAVSSLVLAAIIQSALIPFHTWLLASMTAPTPASALMHAGFVNAGGILLLRFAPVVSIEATVMLLIVLVGAVSALVGKLFKSVQVDTKTRLGSSTVGQMGFMVMQAGLGFFGAAITHLILHGCYKAYLFLSAGEEIETTSPSDTGRSTKSGLDVSIITVLVGMVGGGLFAALTGKGTGFDSGLLLTGLVVLTTLQATRGAILSRGLSATSRYGVVPLVFLPAIVLYALVYNALRAVMADVALVTAPTELSIIHGIVGIAFLVGYLAIETGLYRRYTRLYVTLVNATTPPTNTLLTSRREYHEY